MTGTFDSFSMTAGASITGSTSDATLQTLALSKSTAGAQTLLSVKNPNDAGRRHRGHRLPPRQWSVSRRKDQSGMERLAFYQSFCAYDKEWLRATAALATFSVPIERGANAITGSGNLGSISTYIGATYVSRHYVNATAYLDGTKRGADRDHRNARCVRLTAGSSVTGNRSATLRATARGQVEAARGTRRR